MVLTACETMSPKTQAFASLKAVKIAVDAGMNVYADQVVAGEVSAETQVKVEAAYGKYYAAFNSALDLLENDYSAPPPQLVSDIAWDLLNLLNQIQQ
jgi:hypothetical protein